MAHVATLMRTVEAHAADGPLETRPCKRVRLESSPVGLQSDRDSHRRPLALMPQNFGNPVSSAPPAQPPYGIRRPQYGIHQAQHGGRQVPFSSQPVPYGWPQVPFTSQRRPCGGQEGPYGCQQGPYGGHQGPYAWQQGPYGGQQGPATSSSYTAAGVVLPASCGAASAAPPRTLHPAKVLAAALPQPPTPFCKPMLSAVGVHPRTAAVQRRPLAPIQQGNACSASARSYGGQQAQCSSQHAAHISCGTAAAPQVQTPEPSACAASSQDPDPIMTAASDAFFSGDEGTEGELTGLLLEQLMADMPEEWRVGRGEPSAQQPAQQPAQLVVEQREALWRAAWGFIEAACCLSSMACIPAS
ncbi:hypothetical protein TSOC_007045 [Tetrabaena socialis]|uniref:Uncharacterized protein n=1 Tax=Tetrabaena socialis TaxID=47790 RepID=A0A2J8A268_9CHLO|nr:hypothetical protein TSOC_007045 [Tetrabaena socialis]|eukprot:PNH06588.1 hypothetical protein TSOC_007045 [Tetrabaena socialis]